MRLSLFVIFIFTIGIAMTVDSSSKDSSSNENNREAKKVIWVDTRTQEEYDAGHVKDSLLIPYDEIQDRHKEIGAQFDDDIRVYCRSGRRSGVAKDILNKLGYTDVTNEGGYEEIISRK